MANRIDYTYFDNFRNIANLDEAVILEALNIKIENLEPRFFVSVFGYGFQKAMLADPSNVIYEPILNGVEYTNSNGDLVKWEGINESIANFVYFYWYKERNPYTGGAAFANANLENANPVDPITRPNYAYNKIYDALCILGEYLLINIDDYPTLNFNNLVKTNDFGI